MIAANAQPRWALTAESGYRVALVDPNSGTRRVMHWPSILSGVGGAVAQTHGPYVVLAFGDPAYPGPQQAEALLLYNRHTHRLAGIPGFPAQIDLKFLSLAWTGDGRLVMLIQAAGATRIGIYRPGARTVALRRVHLPVRNGGSASFVPIQVG